LQRTCFRGVNNAAVDDVCGATTQPVEWTGATKEERRDSLASLSI